MILPLRHRAAFTGYGVASLHIETERFENKPLRQLKSPFGDHVEVEDHALLDWSMYDDFGNDIFSIASTAEANFHTSSWENKMILLFSILQRRAFYLHKS